MVSAILIKKSMLMVGFLTCNDSDILRAKTSPYRHVGYQTNIPPTMHSTWIPKWAPVQLHSGLPDSLHVLPVEEYPPQCHQYQAMYSHINRGSLAQLQCWVGEMNPDRKSAFNELRIVHNALLMPWNGWSRFSLMEVCGKWWRESWSWAQAGVSGATGPRFWWTMIRSGWVRVRGGGVETS